MRLQRGLGKIRQCRGGRFWAAGCFAALAAPLLMVHVAMAQPVPPHAEPQITPQSEPPAPPTQIKREPRGLFEAIGRWFDEGTAGFRSHVYGAKTSIDEFNQRAEETRRSLGETAAALSRNAVGAADVTRDAMGSVAKLPLSRIVEGRERCGIAPNGAPDCVAAAETLCRKKGFTTGKSVDFTSAESCPVKAWLGNKQGADAECKTVTFISKAMCQ